MVEVFDAITKEISDIVVNLFELSRQRGRIPKASSHFYPLKPRSKAHILSSTLCLPGVYLSILASTLYSQVR